MNRKATLREKATPKELTSIRSKNGTSSFTLKLDDATQTKIRKCETLIGKALNADPSKCVIIRASIDVYLEHLQTKLTTDNQDLFEDISHERDRLHAAANGIVIQQNHRKENY